MGAGATGNTTAKISLLQGTKLSKIVGKHGSKVATQYVQGNLEGQGWLVQHCEARGLAMQYEDAYSYAQSETGVAAAREELKACRAARLAVEWVDDADVPFPYHGGVRLAAQAQFDPMPLLDSLTVELDERGGRVAQGVRVQKVSGDGEGLKLHVHTTTGDEFDVGAKHCVLATGVPILDRGGFFARLKPSRSYCMAYKVPGDITRGMYISTDSPTRSVRYAPTPDGDRLIVGGAGHPVGREKQRRGMLSLLSFQLFVRSENLGTLNLYGGEPGVFSEDSLLIGGVLAQHAAVALIGSSAEQHFEAALASRDIIGQAKGMLMLRENLTALKAFNLLIRVSQETNIKLIDVARWLVNEHESKLLDGDDPTSGRSRS